MRRLKEAFMHDLQTGRLAPILETVRNDETICLEIRDNYCNLYYKGGNLLRLKAIRDHYSASFDTNYAMDRSVELKSKLPSDRISSEQDARVWLECFPALKQIMDQFWQQRPNQERQTQQRMVVDNNFGTNCKVTDFYICDIEYAVPKEYQFHKKCRFDMVGVRLPATDSQQEDQSSRRLVMFELKYGAGTIKGNGSLQKHARDIDDFLGIENNLKTFKYEMAGLFNQKRKLGLIDCDQDLSGFSDERPLLLLTLLNIDLHNWELRGVLARLPDYANVEVRTATCGTGGFGLFERNVFKLN